VRQESSKILKLMVSILQAQVSAKTELTTDICLVLMVMTIMKTTIHMANLDMGSRPISTAYT